MAVFIFQSLNTPNRLCAGPAQINHLSRNSMNHKSSIFHLTIACSQSINRRSRTFATPYLEGSPLARLRRLDPRDESETDLVRPSMEGHSLSQPQAPPHTNSVSSVVDPNEQNHSTEICAMTWRSTAATSLHAKAEIPPGEIIIWPCSCCQARTARNLRR